MNVAQGYGSMLGNARRGVAQPGSAPALGAGGRPFKSARPDQSERPPRADCHGRMFSVALRFSSTSTAGFTAHAAGLPSRPTDARARPAPRQQPRLGEAPDGSG